MTTPILGLLVDKNLHKRKYIYGIIPYMLKNTNECVNVRKVQMIFYLFSKSWVVKQFFYSNVITENFILKVNLTERHLHLLQ